MLIARLPNVELPYHGTAPYDPAARSSIEPPPTSDRTRTTPTKRAMKRNKARLHRARCVASAPAESEQAALDRNEPMLASASRRALRCGYSPCCGEPWDCPFVEALTATEPSTLRCGAVRFSHAVVA